MGTVKDLGRRSALQLAGVAGAGGLSMLSSRSRVIDIAFAADSGPPLKMKIVDGSGNNSFVLQALLQQQGYLDKFGLNVTFLNVSDGSKVISALIGGDVDVCMLSGFSSLLPAIEKGADLKVLCGGGTVVIQCLYSSKPDVREMKDLIGKTVGIGAIGALEHEIVVAMLRKHGIDESKVTFVNIGANPAIFKAVIEGTVDCGPSEIDVYPSQAKYGVHALTDGKCWEQIPDYTWQAGYTSTRTIAEKRDVLVRTLAAFGTAYKFLTGPNSFDAFLKARTTVLGAAKVNVPDTKFFWDFIQQYKPYAYDLVLSKERIDYVQNLNISLGTQKKLLPYNQVADMSIAHEALKLIG